MAKVSLTLPVGEVLVTGKQITFVAPCSSADLDNIILMGEEFDVIDSMGDPLTDKAFAEGALVSVILNVETKKAVIQNAGSTKSIEDRLIAVPVELGEGVKALQQTPQVEWWSRDEVGNDYISNSTEVEKDDIKVEKDTDGNILTGAFGDYSVSLGCKSQARGKRATSEGSCTVALGGYSHAEGNSTFTVGFNSHAEGLSTTALGDNSHAEGVKTVAEEEASHAEGHTTRAEGYASHAEGVGTIATGEDSHAEGASTKAKGAHSHAEGAITEANEFASHAEGYNCKANGGMSHAEGYDTTASGYVSHAEGWGTKASGQYQHVQGRYNIEDAASEYAHIVGNGEKNEETGVITYSNAHTLDWDGNAWYSGSVKAPYIESTGEIKTRSFVSTGHVTANSLEVTEQITAHGNIVATDSGHGSIVGNYIESKGDVSAVKVVAGEVETTGDATIGGSLQCSNIIAKSGNNNGYVEARQVKTFEKSLSLTVDYGGGDKGSYVFLTKENKNIVFSRPTLNPSMRYFIGELDSPWDMVYSKGAEFGSLTLTDNTGRYVSISASQLERLLSKLT